MLLGQGDISAKAHGLAGNPPKVESVKNLPEYKAYKEKVDKAPLLADKLRAVGADKGFFNPDDPDVPDDLRARRMLALLLLGEALKAQPDSDAQCVLSAALNGSPDASYYGLLLPSGANVQDLCSTKMTVEQALEALKKVNPPAASVVAEGIHAAVPAKYEAYKNFLWGRFKERFTLAVDPFENPLTKGLFTGLLIGGALLLALRLAKK